MDAQNGYRIDGAVKRIDGHDSALADITTQVGGKADQSALTTANTTIANHTTTLAAHTTAIAGISASPKGTYALLTDLTTAFPTGNSNVYLVTADGKWYYWNGSAWTAGGTYQATGIAAKSIVGATAFDDATNARVDNSKMRIDISSKSNTFTGVAGGVVSIIKKTISIPSGQTGNGSFFKAMTDLDSVLPVGATIRLTYKLNLSTAELTYPKFSIALNVLRNGAIVYSVQTNTITDSVNSTKSIDYTIVAGDTQLQTYVMINNTVALTTDYVLTIPYIYFEYLTMPNTSVYNSELMFLEKLKGKQVTIYNCDPGGTEYLLDVTGLTRITLKITAGTNNIIRAYGLLNSTYYPIPMTNLRTGNSLMFASSFGKYSITTEPYTTIKFINSAGDTGVTNLVASVSNGDIVPEIPQQIVGCDYNSKAPNVNIKSYINATNVLGVFNGKAYRAASNVLYSSSNWGVDNFVTVVGTVVGASSLYKLLIMDNGNIIVWDVTGKVFVSVNNGSSFTLLIDMGTSMTHFNFGAKAYGNYLMFCQYSNVIGAATKVYISEDSGVTYREIFDIYNQPNFAAHGVKNHTHSCAIDPFETTIDGKPMLWIVIGDGINQQHYFWSKDFGVTWNIVSPYKCPPIQATEIMPLKNCVLFTGDARMVGVQRYNRPVTGTQVGQYQSIENAMDLFEGWGAEGLTEVPIGSAPFVDFVNNKAYFGYVLAGAVATGNVVNTVCLKGEVWTTDGYSFYKIYENPTTLTTGGCFSVFGDTLGNIVARIDNGSQGHPRFGTDMWN